MFHLWYFLSYIAFIPTANFGSIELKRLSSISSTCLEIQMAINNFNAWSFESSDIRPLNGDHLKKLK